MGKKYELLKEDTIIICGIVLHRIKALQDFGNVKAGDLGGYIEKEDNLSHYGECWVYGNAKVYNNAKLYNNALVSGNAKVNGNAEVSGNAMVYDIAWLSGNAKVSGDAKVYGNVWVHDNARVYDNAQVFGNIEVYGYARLRNNAYIHSDDYICIGPIGSRNEYTTFYLTEDKNIMVSCGCFNGTLEEFIKAVNDTHKDNDKYRSEYLSAIEFVKIKLGYKGGN